MGAFVTSPSGHLFTAYCPWCNNHVYTRVPFDLEQRKNQKQHYRQHIYEDLQNHKISIQEVRKQQQRQLQEYLEGLLLDKAS